MDAYLYKAALYSAEGIMLALSAETGANLKGEDAESLLDKLAKERGIDRANESTFDSDDFPKGPFADGGGEADTPQHCDVTGEHLENPLTEDGSAYVKRAFKDYAEDGRGDRETLALWADFYMHEYGEACEEQDREGLPAIPDFTAPA